jgi:beta-catenin-like protein 1
LLQPKQNPKRDVADDDKEPEFERPGKKLKQFPTSNVKPNPRSTATYIAPPVVETPEKEELLKLVEQDEGSESLDEASLKRMILNFEKRVLKNQELRVKFPDAPEKYDSYPVFFLSSFFMIVFILSFRFMESELELHEAIQLMHALATVPELYTVGVEQKLIPTLLGLLSHDNADISVAVVNLLQELTDIDTLNESQDEAAILIDALLDQQICALLVHNLERLNEAQTEESDGVHNTLGIDDHLCFWNSQVLTQFLFTK